MKEPGIWKEISMQELMGRYYEPQKFGAACEACPNYRQKWSCPPYDYEVEALLKSYSHCLLMGKKVRITPEEQALRGKEAEALMWQKIDDARAEEDGKALKLEQTGENCLALAAGGCRICKTCARAENLPCRDPQRCRPSLESFGFDVGALAEKELGVPLVWQAEGLPEYYFLVNALFSRRSMRREAETIYGKSRA